MFIRQRAVFTISLILLLCLVFSSQQKIYGNSDVVLGTSQVEICFDSQTLGIKYLTNPSDSVSHDSLYFDSSVPLWSVAMLDTTGTMDTTSLFYLACDDPGVDCPTPVYQFEYHEADTSLVMYWQAVTHEHAPSDSIHVTVTADIPHGEKAVSFHISINNESTDHAVFSVDFPRYTIRELDADRNNQVLAFPWRSHGNIILNPLVELSPESTAVLDQNSGPNRSLGFTPTAITNHGLHPGLHSIQFFAYYRNDEPYGLYTATTDTLGYLQTTHIVGDDENGSLECFSRHFPEDNDATFHSPDHPDSTYSMPYQYRMRPFRGDWIDAGKIFREWMIASPIITSLGGPLKEREDTVQVLHTYDYTMMVNPDTVLLAEQLQVFDGLRIGARLNFWGNLTPYYYEYPRNSCTTNYPISPYEVVESIQNHGGFTAPYTNMRDPHWNIYHTTGVAVPVPGLSRAKGIIPPLNGVECMWGDECFDDLNGTRETSWVENINGDSLVNGCKGDMCSAAPLWQRKYVKGISQTISSLGVNSLYTDTRGVAELCYNGDLHGHPNGGGYYFIQGRNTVLDTIRTVASDTFPTANEGPIDVKIGWYDFYVSDGGFMRRRDVNKPNRILDRAVDVPLMPCITHDYQATIMGLGRLPYAEYGENHFAYALSYAFVNGHMLSFRQDTSSTDHWSETQWTDYSYVRSMIEKRKDAAEYLVLGEWMRPPELLDCDVTEVDMFDSVYVLPAIVSSAFVDDGNLGLVFANFSQQSAGCTVSFLLSEYGLPPGTYTTCMIGDDGERIHCHDRSLSEQVTIDLILTEKSVMVYEFVLN